MRAVEMQPAVVQALNVQNQHQQQVAQPQITQEAFAAALARTASLRPEQVQEMEASPRKERPEILGEERGESADRRRSGGGAGEEESRGREELSPETAPEGPGAPGFRIDIVV